MIPESDPYQWWRRNDGDVLSHGERSREPLLLLHNTIVQNRSLQSEIRGVPSYN